MSFHALEHKLLKIMRQRYSYLDKVWVSCSYGVDSLVLLEALTNINPLLGLDVGVIHIHHGPSEDPLVESFRNEAQTRITNYCSQKKLSFKCVKSTEVLSSEKDFRDFRLKSYEQEKLTSVLTAHHKNDYLETLLIKLIRGVGPQGFGFGDSEHKDFKILRPFLLDFTKKEIEEYALYKNLNPVQDPSNEQNDFLRNWIRNKWLTDLENFMPGSVNSLSASLKSLASVNSDSDQEINIFAMKDWMVATQENKRRAIAFVLKEVAERNFTSGQVCEIIKQLDLLKKDHSFKSAGLLWSKNAQKVTFEKI